MTQPEVIVWNADERVFMTVLLDGFQIHPVNDRAFKQQGDTDFQRRTTRCYWYMKGASARDIFNPKLAQKSVPKEVL